MMATKGSDRAALLYISIFFSGMVLHELALERLYQQFNSLPLAASVTLFQFASCATLPVVAFGNHATSALPKNRHTLWLYCQLSVLVFGATALATASLR